MSLSPRLITPEKRGEDAEQTLRPQTLDEFVGQAAVRANLKVFIEAAKGRGEALDDTGALHDDTGSGGARHARGARDGGGEEQR